MAGDALAAGRLLSSASCKMLDMAVLELQLKRSIFKSPQDDVVREVDIHLPAGHALASPFGFGP